MNNMSQEEYEKAWRACIVNARRFVRQVKQMQGASTRHIRYHLSTLALEEIGKIGMLNLSYAAQDKIGESRQPRFEDDNHEKKLFMAFQSLTLGRQILTKELHKSHNDLAKSVHVKRLKTLYVDIKNPIDPSKLLTESEVITISKMADYRIKIEQAKGMLNKDVEHTDHEKEVFRWFLQAADDPMEKQFIFHGTSNSKLVELGDLSKWIDWLYLEHQKRIVESNTIVQEELNRTNEDKGGEFIPKWNFKIKIYSNSHTIRNKQLAIWNKGLNGFKFSQGKDSKWLIVEIILSDAVNISTLWDMSEFLANTFFVSLNVGSIGLFTWHEANDRTGFFYDIKDLTRPEYDARLTKQLDGEFTWDNQKILKETDIANVMRFFGFMTSESKNESFRQSIGSYITAINLYSTTDAHLNLDADAFSHFYDCFKKAATALNDINNPELVDDEIIKLIPGEDLQDELKDLMSKSKKQSQMSITSEDVVKMKVITDLYLNEKAKEWSKSLKGESADASTP